MARRWSRVPDVDAKEAVFHFKRGEAVVTVDRTGQIRAFTNFVKKGLANRTTPDGPRECPPCSGVFRELAALRPSTERVDGHRPVVLCSGNAPDVLAREFIGSLDRNRRGKRFGHIDRTLGRDGFEPRGTAHVGTHEAQPVQDRILDGEHGSEMDAEPKSHAGGYPAAVGSKPPIVS